MSDSTSNSKILRPEIGTRFGQRVVAGYAPPKNGVARVVMQCDCGRINETDIQRVLDGSSTRCMPCPKKKDLTGILPAIGTRFGFRVVKDWIVRKPHRAVELLMRCDCGDESKAALNHLLAGKLTRCIHCSAHANLDNLHQKTREKNALKDRSQNVTLQPEYACWRAMLSRCKNPNDPAYPRYGGKGIKVCEEWHNFKNFRRDMGPRLSKDLTTERMNNSGDYTKENCKWGTWEEQENNKENNVIIEFNGETLTLARWARKIRIKPSTLAMRYRIGWSIERMLTTPVQIQKTHCLRGHELTVENSYFSTRENGNTKRSCRICVHERYLKKKKQ